MAANPVGPMEWSFGTVFWGVVYVLSILSFPYLAWLAWTCEQKKKMGRWPEESPDFLTYWEERETGRTA